MTGVDRARVANLNVDVSEMSVSRLMVVVGESRGESSLGVTGRGFDGQRLEKAVQVEQTREPDPSSVPPAVLACRS